ncbi:MAG: hypothetical protein ACKV19_03425, partial [Verrucomicrobiales bacterium]
NADWRAGCGKSARPVRWEGRRNPMWRPYPYPVKHYLTTVQKSVAERTGLRQPMRLHLKAAGSIEAL